MLTEESDRLVVFPPTGGRAVFYIFIFGILAILVIVAVIQQRSRR